MLAIIDFILDLFRSPAQAARFVTDPDGTLRDAGLPNVTAAQLHAVAASAAPAGVVLGGGDPVVGLQRAVADYHSIASPFSPQTSFSPQPTFAPQTSFSSQPTFAPETEVASRNNTNAEFASPDQSAGANAQTGGFNLGFGDITLGDRTSNTATDGGVVVDGENDGDIVSGDGAVLGDGNTMNNGDILAGSGSNVAVGRDNDIEDNSNTAGGDLITDNDAPVLNEVDTSGGNGGGASGGDSLIGLGSGDASGGDGGSGGAIIITDTSTNLGNTEIGGDSGSDNTVDSSTSTVVQTETQTETTVEDNSSTHESNIASNNDTAFASDNDTAFASNNDTAFDSSTDVASKNDTLTSTVLDAF